MAGCDSVDGALGGWDVAQRGGGHGHAGGQGLRRCILSRQPPQLADVAVEREGGLPQDRVEVLPLFGAHGGSPFGWNSPGSTPGGLAHVNPLLKVPAGRRATARLAARQVRRHHRITVIRATGAPRTDLPRTAVNVLVPASVCRRPGLRCYACR